MSSDAAVARAIFDDARRTSTIRRRTSRGDCCRGRCDRAIAHRGSQLLAFCNGGNAADAQHLVAELVGQFERDRRPFAAVALTADSSVLATIGNDYGYEQIFARQITGLGRRGDIAFGISTSGRSRKVEVALEAARGLGLITIVLTGHDGGPIGAKCRHPSQRRGRVDRAHAGSASHYLLHALCVIVEKRLA